jgi:Fic family protein
MTNTIQKINGLQQMLLSLPAIIDENKRRLDKKFRLEFNFNSNHIEGNTLTYGETELLLIFDKTEGGHEMRELEEMKAHDVAYNLIKDWASDNQYPLNEQSIKELNKIILVAPFYKDAITPDGQVTRRLIKIGDYKEHPNSVRLQNGEIFNYTSPAETPIKMGELMEWYKTELEKKELHPVELASLMHYKFVCIHPFDDGNGRISRLLMNYILIANDFPPVIIKSEDKKNYLFALNQADTGNIAAFIDYIAGQLMWSLETTLKATKGESIDELGDFDKRIKILKSPYYDGLSKKEKRSPDIIKEIIDYSIFPFFEVWENKLQKLDSFFNDRNVFVKLDDKHSRGSDLNDTASVVYNSVYDVFDSSVRDFVKTILVHINFIGFRTDSYSDLASYNGGGITVTFFNHTYQISNQSGEVYANKTYTILLNDEEKNVIAEKLCLPLVEQIEFLTTKHKNG